MTERLHTRFYYGTDPYYSLMIATRENVLFLGAFLAVMRLGGGPPWFQMGYIVCLDPDEVEVESKSLYPKS